MSRSLIVGCFVLAFIVPAGNGDCQEWTRFRGPNGAGQSDADGIPTQWTEDDYNWKVALGGIGHGSPVLWGDRLFVLSAEPDNATRHVFCLDVATGRPLWTRSFDSQTHHLHLRNSFASTTPAVDAEHVYLAWSTPKATTLMALDHQGETVWQRDLGAFVSMHGFGTSPVLVDDLVILCNMQQGMRLDVGQQPGKSFVVALDRRDGATRWQTPRDSAVAAYSSPCVYRPDGGPAELICNSTAHGICSLDLRTGRQNWSRKVFTMRTVSSPVVAGGLVFGTTGSGGGGNYLVAVRPGEAPQEVYRIRRQAPYVSTPVAAGELLFLFYDRGIVTCIDAPTGKVHFSERVGGSFSGSPIHVGQRIFCISDEGEVVVLAATKRYEVLARNPLGEPSRATPAVAGNRMYLRTYSHLISVGGK